MFENVVVGFNDSDDAARAMHRAMDVARSSGGTLHVVSVGDSTAKVSSLGRLLDEVRALADSVAVPMKVHPLNVEPAEAITSVATEEQADLIIMGAPLCDGARRLSRVPQRVLDEAPCAVMVV